MIKQLVCNNSESYGVCKEKHYCPATLAHIYRKSKDHQTHKNYGMKFLMYSTNQMKSNSGEEKNKLKKGKQTGKLGGDLGWSGCWSLKIR